MGSKVLAIICLTTVVVNGQRNECEKKRMDYFRCEKKIESDDSLPTLCDKIDAILARCFDVYRECADNEVLEASKQEYITELVDTPINEPVWQNLKKCKLIQSRLATSKCDYETVLMNKYHHKECIERDKEAIFKPLMSSEDLQTAVCESFNRVAVGECAQYHWLCHDQEAEERNYIQGWLNYWDTKLKGYEPVSIKKCHGYVHETEGTVRMFANGK
jgi:hypothetical protein